MEYHPSFFRCASMAILLLLLFLPAAGLAQVPVLRISAENTADHVQTRAIARFADQVQRTGKGRIEVRFYHSARLFRDRDVIAALTSGKVEMAVPGMWQLDRYVPDTGLYMLPLFYGVPAATHYRVRDGGIGLEVNRRIEQNLNVKVPGRWLDLGHAHLYFTGTQVTSHKQLTGLRIRIPGGAANRGRLDAFRADPVVIPWPDLPNALDKGKIQGVLTTHETVRSAALWTKGIRYGFEDREYFAQYVPMINARFWQSLSVELQQLLISAWEQVVSRQREEAAAAQQQAREILQENGIEIITPDEATLAEWRRVARRLEPAIIRELNIDTRLVRQAESVVTD